MPAADTQQKRAGLPLVPGLLWAGVGLAPVAALLVLFGGERVGLVRVAVLLAIVALGLIGASMAMRKDPETVRSQVEDMVYEELDILRDEVREDITTAARATHKALGERVGNLQQSVDVLRGQVDNLRVQGERPSTAAPAPAQPARTPVPAPPPPPIASPSVGSHGVVRHTETVKVTTRQTIVDNNDNGIGRGTVYGSRSNDPAVPAQRRPERAPAAGSEPGESWTEQLLRQRLAEGRLDDSLGDGAFGRYQAGSERFAGGSDRFGDRPGERALAERFGTDRPPAEPYRSESARPDRSRAESLGSTQSWNVEAHFDDDRSEDRYSGFDEGRGGRRRATEPDDGITGVRAADRWASVRSDDRGQELRMGERRTAMQANGSGTEMRIEDRWAAVRREEARRDEGRRDDSWRDDPRRDESWRDEGRRDDSWRDEGRREDSWRDEGRRDDSWRDEARAGRWSEGGRDRGAGWGREESRGWEEPRGRDGGGWSRDGGYGRESTGSAYRSEARWEEPRADEAPRWDQPRARAALPSTPSEPSASEWMENWTARPEPISERVSRRSRDDGPEQYGWRGPEEDEPPPPPRPAPPPRSADYSDERWR